MARPFLFCFYFVRAAPLDRLSQLDGFLNLRKSMSAGVIDRDVTRSTMACSLNRILTI